MLPIETKERSHVAGTNGHGRSQNLTLLPDAPRVIDVADMERFERNLAAGRQLYGYYRNPYTDDASIRDPKHPNRRTVSNTAPLVFGGKLYSLKEDGLPYELDPNTLATRKQWNAKGAWRSETFSARPMTASSWATSSSLSYFSGCSGLLIKISRSLAFADGDGAGGRRTRGV